MAFLFKFILFIFVVGVAVLAYFAFRIYLAVRKVKKQFHGDQEPTHGPASGSSTTMPNGEILTDTRTPERAGRKIIADDEGEYVDFEED